MFKKCKVVMLPTNEKSKLFIGKISKQLNDLAIPDKDESTLNQNLYIISNEEIKDNDYYIENNNIFQANCNFVRLNMDKTIFKIIASTNESLNLPELLESFVKKYIEEYNKKNIISEVMIEYDYYFTNEPKYKAAEDSIGKKFTKLKVDSKDNTVIIKKVKDSWNREEVISLLKDFRAGLLPITKKEINYTNQFIEDNL